MEKSLKTVMVIKHRDDFNYTLIDGETGVFLCERPTADDVLKELAERQAVCIEFMDKMFQR